MTTRAKRVKNLRAYVERNATHAESLLERAAKAIEEAREHLRHSSSFEDDLEPIDEGDDDEETKEPPP